MIQKLLHIGVDLDGTLANHTKTKLALAEELGWKVRPHETASEILERLLPQRDYRTLQQRLYGERVHLAEPFPKAGAILRELSLLGHRLTLVSRRGIDGQKQALDWIAKHLPAALFTGGMFFVETDAEKDAMCRVQGIELFIDDQVEVLRGLLSVKQRILFDPFRNFIQNPPEDMVVCDTWPGIFLKIQTLAYP